MGRTASPVTPGASTAPADSPEADKPASTAPDGAAQGAQATSPDGDLRAQVEAQAREMAEMRATIKLLARNQIATAMPEKVELPTMKDTMAKKPEVAVLTEEGWYVPPVHPTDRLKG